VHFCASETIDSFEFFSEPDISKPSVPLVGDFTSTILSRRIDISKYGVIYAAGGKNLGPSKTCHFSFHFF
jgi:phosphoserine aminotransferase